MAWIRTTELLESSKVTANEKGELTGERVFRVEYDDLLGGGIDAIFRTSIRRGDAFVDKAGRFEPRLLCISVSSPAEDPEVSLAWLVTYGYSSSPWDKVEKGLGSGGTGKTTSPPPSQQPNPNDENSPLNPLNRPWVLRSESVSSEREVWDYDLAGTAMVNSAGDFYEAERETRITQLTIERNVLLPSFQTQMLWEMLPNTCNAKPFLLREPGTVRLDAVNWSSEVEPPFVFARQVLIFSIKRPPSFWPNDSPSGQTGLSNADTWQWILKDEGWFEFVAGKRVRCVDQYNQHIKAPLNGAGAKLTDAQILARSFVFRKFIRYPLVDWTDTLGFN